MGENESRSSWRLPDDLALKEKGSAMSELINFLKRSKIVKYTIIILLLICALYFGIFFLVMKGEPFDAAKQYIYGNKLIGDEMGTIKTVNLSMFSSSIQYSGASGNAQYKIYVDGEKNKGVVYIDMEKQAGVWVIVRANLIHADNSKVVLEVKH
jgi:hypothetical protein